MPKISLSPVAQSPSLAHSPAGLAAQTLPKPHPEAMRSPGRQHRTPAVLSEVTSEAPQTPAAWGPASPNLTTHPSRTLPGDGTPRPQIVSWAAGMPRSDGREEPVLPRAPTMALVQPRPHAGQVRPQASAAMRCQGVETEVQLLKPPRPPGTQHRLDFGADQLTSALQKSLPLFLCPNVPSTLARSQNPVSSVGKVVNSTSLWGDGSPHLWSSVAPKRSESRAGLSAPTAAPVWSP